MQTNGQTSTKYKKCGKIKYNILLIKCLYMFLCWFFKEKRGCFASIIHLFLQLFIHFLCENKQAPYYLPKFAPQLFNHAVFNR